jgi:hypothetical protein
MWRVHSVPVTRTGAVQRGQGEKPLVVSVMMVVSLVLPRPVGVATGRTLGAMQAGDFQGSFGRA